MEDKYTLVNKRLIRKMNEELAEENPKDLRQRQIQGDVLKNDTLHHNDGLFVKSPEMNIDDALDRIDELRECYGLNKTAKKAVYDFSSFPTSASRIGFLSDLEGGYYPNNKTKPNQDAYLAGEIVMEPDSMFTMRIDPTKAPLPESTITQPRSQFQLNLRQNLGLINKSTWSPPKSNR
ncbi:hypothetical protein THAOC_00944 [Thalassiosira oceanica]|uniref:Uncharacterized protein n=1 Tax=Thalassiosira oceanica TaxID=159749 RepID=K0TNL4_THAOC|nr:hypothetical protein THAOC_00944 [Thalassiosira oceanica]|eukprot:EJK77236.1 hypothetical protein THAOC_00944 [Thalassiosira oceanica]